MPVPQSLPAMPPGTSSVRGYRPWLDGLRAVAIAIVLVEHGIGGFGLNVGGSGVGIFFALSGYLITGLLADEWDRRGSISLRTFYWRRSARLIPALVAVVVVCNILFVVLHQRYPVYASFAALTYTANYAAVLYGDHLPAYGPTWSLAVEEHFYLVWPLVAIFFLRRWGLRGLLWGALGLSAAALAWRGVLFALDAPGRLFYVGSIERADALLFGCAAAVAVRLGWRPGRWALPLGVVLVAAHLLGYVGNTRLLNSTILGIGGALICVSLDFAAPNAVRRALSLRPIVWMGVMSYGIYLWHSPLISVRAALGIGREWNALPIIAAFLLAAVSHRFLERPVRSWARSVDIAHEPLPLALASGGHLVWRRVRRRQVAVVTPSSVDARPSEVAEPVRKPS